MGVDSIVFIVLFVWLAPSMITGLVFVFDDHLDKPARTQVAIYIQFVLTAVPLLLFNFVHSACNFIYRLITNK